MSFEDRLQAAVDEQRQKAQATDAAAQRAIEKTNQARQSAVAMLPEVRSAIGAIQALPTTGPHDATVVRDGKVLGGNGWSVFRETEVQKKALRRPVSLFATWTFSIGYAGSWTTFHVGATWCNVTYRTSELQFTSPAPMTVEAFADLGRVTWNGGSYKDATWQAGTILANVEFDKFLTAAAALVAKLTT